MGKTVIITDGCRGIGAALAKKYAEKGFNIVIVGTEVRKCEAHSERKLENMKLECEKLGAKGVLLLSFDLTDAKSFDEIVAESRGRKFNFFFWTLNFTSGIYLSILKKFFKK